MAHFPALQTVAVTAERGQGEMLDHWKSLKGHQKQPDLANESLA